MLIIGMDYHPSFQQISFMDGNATRQVNFIRENAKCVTVEDRMAHRAIGCERELRRTGRNYSGRLSLCSSAGQRGSGFRWSKAGKRMTAVSSSSRSA
jgi:hypothetical protein